MPSGENPVDIQARIRFLEVRIKALRREKEELSLLAQKRPWRSLLMRAIPVVLRVALWVAALMGVLLAVIFVAFILFWRPR